MPMYRVTCYPNMESYEAEVYADSIEKAIEEAHSEAFDNAYFYATEKDVELIKEESCPDCNEYIPQAKGQACKLEKCKYEL